MESLPGKGVQRCRSLPSVALRSFLYSTPVSQNTTQICCSVHARLPLVGDAVKAGGRRNTIPKGLDICSDEVKELCEMVHFLCPAPHREEVMN